MQAVEPKPKRKYTKRVKVTEPVSILKSPTRKGVIQFIDAYGGKAFYSGKQRKLFITNPKHRDDIEENVIAQYRYSLPFSLATNN